MNDLISRSALLVELGRRLSIVDMLTVAEIVGEIPCVDAEPVVHAHWIPAPDIGDCCYRCSRCGKHRDSYIDEDGDHCARCGAHMDEEVV